MGGVILIMVIHVYFQGMMCIKLVCVKIEVYPIKNDADIRKLVISLFQFFFIPTSFF